MANVPASQFTSARTPYGRTIIGSVWPKSILVTIARLSSPCSSRTTVRMASSYDAESFGCDAAAWASEQDGGQSRQQSHRRIRSELTSDRSRRHTLFGGFQEEHRAVKGAVVRPQRRAAQPLQHLQTPADEPAVHDATTLQHAPRHRRLERSLAPLVAGIFPIQELVGPAGGVRLNAADGRSREQRSSHRVCRVGKDSGVLGKPLHHRRTVKGSDPGACAHQVRHRAVREPQEDLRVLAYHTQVNEGQQPDRVVTADRGHNPGDRRVRERAHQVVCARARVPRQPRRVAERVRRFRDANAELGFELAFPSLIAVGDCGRTTPGQADRHHRVAGPERPRLHHRHRWRMLATSFNASCCPPRLAGAVSARSAATDPGAQEGRLPAPCSTPAARSCRPRRSPGPRPRSGSCGRASRTGRRS